MQDLESRKDAAFPPIKLLLTETNIPEDSFPPGQVLVFPTYARLSTKQNSLTVEMIVRDPDDRDEYDRPILPDFESNPPILPLVLQREKLVKLLIENSWTSYPKARLYIRDPLGVFAELYLFFEPWSNNHPAYHVEAFAKMLRDHIGLAVEYQEQPPEPKFPF